MRNLTIKRHKAFSGCLVKTKVYIEDPSSNEIVINGTNCRKLGEVKNGETNTFEIGDGSVRIFTIAGKMSKGFCSDLYRVEEGTEDVSLSGEMAFDLSTGNAFRFDGNNSAEAAEYRNRGSKNGMAILVTFLVIGLIAGFIVGFSGVLNGMFEPEEKTFKVDDMSITLNENFSRTDENGYTACFMSKDVLIMALKEESKYFDEFDGISLREYADLLSQANESKSGVVKEKDGMIYYLYDYTDEESGNTYNYYTYLYKTPDAFWFIQFCADKKSMSSEKSTAEYEEKFQNWAKSVKFDTESL